MELAEFLFVTIFLSSGLAAYIIARKYLIYGFEKNYWLSLSAFVVVCMASVGLLLMLVMEILGKGSNSMRYSLWVIFISVLNYATLFVLPGLLIHKSVGALKNSSQKLVVFGILFVTYTLFIFYNLMKEQAQLATTKGENHLRTFFLFNASGIVNPTIQFNFVSKIGVGIISALSGFSIVYLPFEFFRYYDPLITHINKAQIEKDMAVILEEIKTQKMEMAKMALESEEAPSENAPKDFISSIMNGFLGRKANKFEKNIEEKKRRVKLIQQILNSLFIDYAEISKEEKNFEMTKEKKLWSWFEKSLAIALLIYGCYKIITTIIFLFLGRTKPIDPISGALNILATRFNYKLDQQTAEYIISDASLVFIGLLIITNIRGFALTAHKFLRLFFKSFLSQFVSSELILLITTEIVGIYFLSTFFLLQQSTPQKYKANLSVLLTIDYVNIYRIFDIVLLVSCICWLIVLSINVRARHSKYSGYLEKDN